MRRSVLLWVVALIVTVAAAIYQEATGPTFPIRGKVAVGDQTVTFKLLRSWATGDQPVTLEVVDPQVQGRLRWRRYPTSDDWNVQDMQRKASVLEASLPHQPPAGKLEYQVELARGEQRTVIPVGKTAVTRFKGEVSLLALIPHVAMMFLAMLFSTRAGLAGLTDGTSRRFYTFTALLLTVVGGFILGPIVQKAAFGAYWTGIPWGWDLTDNKTLFMGIGWALAAWNVSRNPRARWSLVFAAVLTLAVFVIPHSVWGSEIRWQ